MASSRAIRRSLDIYYRDKERVARMDALNAAFIKPGDLVFDVGAHVGDRTGSALRLGASVVALEPQPHVFRALRLLYGRNPKVRLVQAAAGEASGQVYMHVNSANPTVSTVASDFIASADGAEGWAEQVWDQRILVDVTTLDQLIETHGCPDFVKIDVEGHEPAVLRGLGEALPCLSFEITIIQRDAALACVARLEELGRYQYNLSLGEEHRLQFNDWLKPQDIRTAIASLPDSANSGDVFARLI